MNISCFFPGNAKNIITFSLMTFLLLARLESACSLKDGVQQIWGKFWFFLDN